MTWVGSEALRGSLVPIASVRRHPQNPRRGDVEEIVESLKRFGQVRQILVDEEGTVIAGNHTLLAAERLGWDEISVNRNRFSSPEEARAYLLADNRLPELGDYDRAELLALVAELEEAERFAGTGYTGDDLAHLRAVEAAASAPPPEPPPAPPADVPAPPSQREVILIFEEAGQAEFASNVRALIGRYGLEGVTETVLRALREEALLVNQGAPA